MQGVQGRVLIPGCNNVIYSDGRHRALTSNYICTPSGPRLRRFARAGRLVGGWGGEAVRIEAGKGQGSRWHPICPSYVRAVIPTD